MILLNGPQAGNDVGHTDAEKVDGDANDGDRTYDIVGGELGDPVLLREADTLTSSLFPDLSLPVARVFRYVRRR